MRILFDHNVDHRFRRQLPNHTVRTARDMRCDELRNGILLKSAAAAGFDVFLSIDKKIEYEHNLSKLPMPVVILDVLSNALPYLLPLAPAVNDLFSTPLSPALYVIASDGSVQRLSAPR